MATKKKIRAPRKIVFYVSPKGNDSWSGRRASPDKSGRDGPFATVRAAQSAVRKLRGKSGLESPVRVELRGGVYCMKTPLVFTGRDSGIPAVCTNNGAVDAAAEPVVYAAYRKEKPVLSGGRRLTGWREEDLNGNTVWVTNIPAVKKGTWNFRQLFVNGQRRMRPILPRDGFYRINKLARAPSAQRSEHSWRSSRNDRFYFEEGDLARWKNLEDVELVTLQCWIESRMWLRDIDEKKNLVRLDRPTVAGLAAGHSSDHEGTEYFVENVFEALSEPGEWYLDRKEGKLYYLPMPGEKLASAEIYAPAISQLLRIEGGSRDGQEASHIRFEGIGFAHTEWRYPDGIAASNQAANGVPGAIVLRRAHWVSFECCTFSHLGNYGIELLEDCRDNEIRRCSISDLGAGGVKAWHGSQRTTIADCEIGHGGRIFHSAVGVLIGMSSGNKVLHNHIHDFRYTGVSVGWRWGYTDGDAYGNLIEYNHIHDIGHGYLSDMGGIYTLGPSQGTRLRYNLIHDVCARGYGGWGIYPDEGSSDILIENNVVYDCNRSSFHQHYGRDNIVRNNIFVCGGQHQLAVSRAEAHCSLQFERNIVYFDCGGLLAPAWNEFNSWPNKRVDFDHNLYFDARGRRMDFSGMSLREWRALGRDVNSLVADPKFVDVNKRDFRLRKNSPAFRVGFIPFDLSTVGPRSDPPQVT